MRIKQRRLPESFDNKRKLTNIDWMLHKWELVWTLSSVNLPKNEYVKIGNHKFTIKVWNTKFRVDYFWKSFWYRITNLSNNEVYIIKKWEEKTIWREWEILIDDSDIKASRQHLKVRVDEEGNLFLCDISKYGTLINPVESNEKKKSTIKCEKMTSEEINEFKKFKKSEGAKLFYDEDERYKPVNKINLWNWKILYITDKLLKRKDRFFWYWLWWYHERIIWYIKIWDELQLRMFYKSKSEWVWRSCPWNRVEWGYSKWEFIKNYSYETTTKVESKLFTLFENLNNNECLKRSEDPIDKSEKLWATPLKDDMEKEIQVDSLFQSDELMDYLIKKLWINLSKSIISDEYKERIKKMLQYYKKLKDRKENLPSAWKIMHADRKWEKESIPFVVVKDIYDNLVPAWLNYKDIHKVVGENYQYQHLDFWTINVNVYETNWNWKKIKIHFWSVKNNHPEKIWIDNIIYSEDEVNTFWTYKKPINAAPLVAKPADYEEQSPCFWSEKMKFKLSSSNMDIRDLYQDNPIIKHYKKIEWLS